MSDAYLSLQHLKLEYGTTVAVSDLSLDIEKGELIVLLGPSGCGKSTTMRAIAGLMDISGGRIVIDGQDMTHVPPNKRGIGLVFQSYALFPHLSAFENVAFGLRLKRCPEKQIKLRTEQVLATVGLCDLAARAPAELSGGQQQRLALARSLVMEPSVLLLDEPLSNLDARLRLELRGELQNLQRETGITMVFVTHDQSEALALADRIVLMREGEIEQVDTPQALYSEPRTRFAADFMGYENIFQLESGCLASEQGQLAYSEASNASCLGWRPSGVTVGQGPYKGTVRAVSFAGEYREYLIDSALGSIKAEASLSDRSFAIGETVNFALPLANSRTLLE